MMVSSIAVSSVLSMFCRPSSLFDILNSLWMLYIPYDAVPACHTLEAISIGR